MSAVPCFPACQSQQLRSPVHDEYSVASPRARSRPHGRPENDVSGSRRPLELEPLLSAQRGVCTAVLGVSFHRNQPLFLVTTVQLPIAQRNRFATTRHKHQQHGSGATSPPPTKTPPHRIEPPWALVARTQRRPPHACSCPHAADATVAPAPLHASWVFAQAQV